MDAWIGQIEIPAEDPERAAEFYRRVFGWRMERVEWAGPVYLRWNPETSSGAVPAPSPGVGLFPRSELGAEQPLVMIHVAGEGLEAVLGRVTIAGGAVVAQPQIIEAGPAGQLRPLGEWARFRDPEGNLLGLWRSGVPDAE